VATERFGAKEKIDLINRHADCEVRGDWDGALATMTANPFYVLYPTGLRVSGREAVGEQWKRLVAVSDFGDALTSAGMRHWVLSDTVVTMFEWIIDEGNGKSRAKNSYALFTFTGKLIESETIFAYSEMDALTRIRE
jgi:hypothetical protein